jgi:hypothetical protein
MPAACDVAIGMMDELWNNLHYMFDTDDGSLPDIYVLNLSAQSVKEIWAYLRQSAADLASDASFWHIANGQTIRVDAVPNAAELVVSGEAESFHAVLRGISFDGAVIPDLGVFVFPEAIYLDYRMGPEWGPAQLGALFELLNQLQLLDREAVVTLPEECTAEARKRFATAFADYRENAA